jgi:hypothetical protein
MKFLARLLSSLAWLAATAAFAADTAAPQLSSIAITPASVDVASAGQPLTITLVITDNESGLSHGNLFMYNQAGNFIKSIHFDHVQRTAGDALNGTYAVTMQVPRYGPPGTWRVDAWLMDNANNSRNLGGSNEPFPVPADATFTVVNSGQIDSSAPVLTASTVTPATPEPVDTGTADQHVTVAFACTDNLAGLHYGWVYVWEPDGTFRDDLLQFFSASAPLSGDKLDGTYEVQVPLARNSTPGNWTMQIFLTDEVGNHVFTPIDGFTVTNNVEPAGTLAGALDAVHLPWLTTTPGWVHQTAVNHDGVDAAASPPLGDGEDATLQTTVTGPGVLSFQWRVDSEQDADFLSVEVMETAVRHEISGNTPWAKVSLTIPAGLHTIVWTYAKSGATASGADRGWLDEVRFLADEDSTLPVLQALRITPDPANVAIGPQFVTFTIEFTDDHHGLSEGYLNLYTPSGDWYDSVWLDPDSLVKGDLRNGTLEVTYEFPQESEYGEWRVALELTEAVTGITRFYNEGDEPFPTPGEELFTLWDGVSGDLQAPRIEELTLNPTEADVSTAAATLTVTLRITDAQAGFRDGNIDVFTQTGDWTGSVYFTDGQRITGDSADGTYEVTVPVPRYGPPGTWRIQCQVTDHADNTRDYPFGTAYPDGVDATFTVVNSGPVDSLPPTVTAIDITPGTVDPSTAPATLQVTVSLTDDLSGIRDAYLFFYDPQNAYYYQMFKSLDATTRISGDALTGTHQASVTVPQGIAAGTWTIRVFLRDMVGRTRFYGLDGPAYPEPGDGKFIVSSGADTEAPRITELAITPASVDISGAAAAATVTVTARITDSQAGFRDGNIDVLTPTGEWTGSTYFTGGQRVSGDEFDGIYEIEVPVPRHGPPGTWRIQGYVSDEADNGRNYPSDTAFPAGANETFAVVNTGPVDLLAPAVTAIDITPKTLATPGTLAITVSISDDLSGIRDAQLHFLDPLNAGYAPLFTVLDASNRTSGDAVNATHLVSLALPPGLATGTWTIRVFLRDMVGRTRFYGLDGPAYPEPGDGTFTVGTTPQSTFKAFMATHQLTGDDALPTADPDHDGRNNGLELMLGTHPNQADPAGAGWYSLSRDATHLHMDFTIDPALTVTVNGDHLELRDGGGGAPLLLTGQTQAGLAGGPWTTVPPALVAGSTWRVSLALTAGRGFVRLAFEDP